MKCPFCGHEESSVVDKRDNDDSTQNRRRRECKKCNKRFTTYEKITGLLTKIRKRDGKEVDFNQSRITEAMWKAAQAVGGKDKDITKKLSDKVVQSLEEKFGGYTVPTVEQIQDVVEKTLVENGHYKTAKAYILYRKQREKLRKTRNIFVDVNTTINNYLGREDWRVKENSNEAFSFSGLLLYTAGRVMANYNLNEMYTHAIADAHRLGQIHIHDLSHGVIGYCCGHSLKNLIVMGFGGVKGKADCKPSKHLSTLVHQMVNYIGCLQMEFAGAQAFNSVDTLLAPFVRQDNLTYKQVKQAMQQLVFSLNIPSRWGSQYPFSNLTFDLVPPPDLKKEKAVVGGKEMDYTYGDCQKEMDMINLAYLEVIGEGDANGRTFSFPIPTYNLTKDFDWDGEIAQRLFQAAAKYGTPYFQNYIGSDLDPSSVRAMCCRLNMDLTQLMNRPGGMWSMGDSSITGNTPVWIKIGETWKMKPIEEVYKEGLKGLKTISFNPLTAEIEEVGVAQCVKHGKRNVFKLRTNQGNISITQDHCMFNVTDGGDVANATIEDIKRTGYFLAPRLPKIGSVYRLNVAENLIEGGYSDKRARVLIKNTTVFDRLMGCEISKRYVRKFYKNSFTDIKSKWKNSNFGKPTIAFNLFKLLYKAGKIRAKDLKEMHLCKIKHKLPLLLDLGYELGFITGLFLAEGSCHEACLAANDDVELLKLCRENARKALGIKPVLYKPRKGKVGLVTFNSPFVANYLKFGLGLEGHSSTKAVPEYIPNSNEDMIKGVIDGFYLGDGHETKDYIELATSSKKLAEGLMLLLKRIRGRFALRYYKKGGSYTVRITEYDGRAVSIKRKLDKDIRHLMGVFSQGVAELKKQISTTDAVKMGLPQAFYNPQYIPRESNVLKGIAILKRRGLMSGYFSTVARFMENYERVDVLDISYSGQNDVYDLSVPGYENFIAGPGMFFTHNTGSIGVVTINLNRIGYEAKNRDEFFQILRERMELAKQAHEIKRKVIETNLKNGLMPYTKRYLGTFNNHFSTIGLCGMNEACMNLLGKDISTPEGKQLAIDTLNFMRERTREYQQETGNLYNLEATPAESTSYRFGKMDKEMCPDIITSGTDVPYVTNSSQLPVDWTDDPIKAIEHQNDIQPLYTGGTIFHTFLGEKMTDWKAARDLVRRIAENTKLPYFSLTPTFSVCPDHGYFKGEQFKCPEPKCGKECEVFSRIVGYYRPVQNWNVGKQEEFKDRKTFLESKAVQNKFAKEAPKEAPKEEPKACSCAA